MGQGLGEGKVDGELAEEFIRQAEENQHAPRRTSSSRQRATVREMERQLREYIPSWKR